MRLIQPSVFLVFLILSGCQAQGPKESRGLYDEQNPVRVVTTTSIIADLAGEIGRPFVNVEALMGPNVDPHLYKASEGDVSLMSRADLVLYSGLHLEGKMVDIFEQMAGRGMNVRALADVFSADDLLESGAFAGNYDPHFWFDAQMWKKAASRILSILSEEDPAHAATYAENLEMYASRLDSLDQWIHTQMQGIPEEVRVLITSHDAFGYFGRAYNVDVRGLQGLSTATEAGTGDVQRLAEFVADRKIPALFVESSISPRGIEAVREAVRARGFDVQIGGTLYGDALGSPGSSADTYLGMVRTNVELLVHGLLAN